MLYREIIDVCSQIHTKHRISGCETGWCKKYPLGLKLLIILPREPYGDFKGKFQSPLPKTFFSNFFSLLRELYSVRGGQKLVRFSCEVTSPDRC